MLDGEKKRQSRVMLGILTLGGIVLGFDGFNDFIKSKKLHYFQNSCFLF
jgi:hypothetical protein